MVPGTAYVVLAIADSAAARRGATSAAARRWRLVLKPALMPTLAAALAGAPRRGGAGRDTRRLRAGTATALAFSWGGDVALLGTGERSFLTGVGSFFGAHVAYLAAFWSVRGERGDHDRTGLVVASGLWLTLAPLLSAAAGRKDPALRLPVAAYATILSGMFAGSRLLDPALPRGARRAVRAGTALFLVSDTVLAVQEFVLDEPRPALEAVVMATYTTAQGLIVAGVARAS
jgi:uncharacterized membrane protein YhhN